LLSLCLWNSFLSTYTHPPPPYIVSLSHTRDEYRIIHTKRDYGRRLCFFFYRRSSQSSSRWSTEAKDAYSLPCSAGTMHMCPASNVCVWEIVRLNVCSFKLNINTQECVYTHSFM
jgi:hypothetical protein